MTDDLTRLTEALAGQYAVRREIGRGGMATVYLAHDVKHHRDVAVKVLKPELAAAVGADRFLREIEIAARLSHPHILPLYDSGHTDDTLYYVMPFVEGESLHDRLLREKQLAIGDAVNIAREVADALHHAHSHGVIHRDIKPANIMLVSKHAVVSDFGVALLAQAVDADRLTTSGVSIGTPIYMSPEQASGSVDIDGRSDTYSLGCVLYEMLGGEPPFDGPTPHAILAKKMAGRPSSLRIVRESVSEALEAVTFKALSRTAADRFGTAAEFADALASAAEDSRRTTPHRGVWVARDPAPAAALEHPAKPFRATAATRATSRRTQLTLAQLLAMAAGVILVPTAVGFLTTTVYDQVIRVPYQYTPSRADFPIIGLRALIPALFAAFVLLTAYVMAKPLLRIVALGLSRSAQLRPTLLRLKEQSSHSWQNLWSGRPPAAVAEIWFVLAMLVSAAVVARFVSHFNAAADTGAGIFACDYRDVHRSFTFAMTVLIAALVVSWIRVFRYLDKRRAGGASLTVARWGGLALICALALILTAPWRVLWTESPRALLNGERYYIIRETDANLLLYNPRARLTEHYPIADIPQLQRLNTSGYIFEDEQAFAGPEPGC